MLATVVSTVLLLTATASPPKDPAWVTLYTSPSVSWFARNFQVVQPTDKFTFELRMKLHPGFEIKGEVPISQIDSTVEASCWNKTAQVTRSTIYNGTQVIAVDAGLDPSPVTPEEGSVTATILKVICGQRRVIDV